MNLEELRPEIKKYALQNAVQFEGKANPGTVIGKLLASDQSLKSQMKDISMMVQEIIKEVVSLSLDEQKEQLAQIDPSLLEKKKKEKREFEVPDLKDTENLVMRFAPNPNGPMSFGHARQALINWWFVKKYNGQYILRLDDTDPKTKVPLKEAYEWIPQDLEWLGIKPDLTVKQSERFDIYYDYAKQLIQKEKAYIDTQDPEEMRVWLRKGQASPDRDLPVQTQLERWENMLNGTYKDGEAILRMKTDLEAKNPAVRDWPMARIITDGSHPLRVAKVWPLLNFSSAIDDHELKVTHIVRGVDLMISDERQKYLYDVFGWKYPQTIYTGKLILNGVKSTSQSRLAIENGELTGWDDIRLGTLQALKRRGYTPQSIEAFMKSVGTNKNNVEVSLENLTAFNKDTIDETSNRYFFVNNPVQITIEGAPEQEVTMDLHPKSGKGGRTIKTANQFNITKEDFDQLKDGELFRLIDCLNAKKQGDKFVFVSTDLEDYKKEGKHILHWVTQGQQIEVLMPDATTVSGILEDSSIKIAQTVQFERFGFCKKDEENKFWFTHK